MAKIIRRICGFFITLSFMFTAAPLVFADSNLSYFQHIKESGTWYRDMYRSAFWGILKLLGEVINYIEEAVKEVLSWNIYTKLTEIDSSFSYENVKGVALIIVVVAITFAGILLMVNGDKMHVKDSVKNILVALCLIVGMPAIMGALDDFMFGADRKSGYASEIGVTNHNVTKEGTVIKLGDKILSMQVYDNVASVKNKTTETLYSATYDKNGKEKKDKTFVSPQEIDINKLATQKEINVKYVSSEVNRTQRKYSDLTYENCADLLGMGAEYRKLINVQDKIALSVKTNTSTSDDSSNNSKSKSEAEVKTDKYKFSYAFEKETRREWTVEQFETHMIDILKAKTYNDGKIKVSDAKRFKDINSNTMTFEQAMEAIKGDIIWQLNYQENVKKADGKVEDVHLQKLRTIEDYKDLSWISQIVTVDMWEPNSDERVYAYDYDFFPAFIDMVIVIVCLIFALLKLCRMLWEIAFMHIFVPFVIATDAHGSGRAKRAFQHLISTFAILIVVLITLNLYLTLIGKMHEIGNLIARWGLILAGAHFVIDGSDFIIKMTGLDAGVKSGAATLLGLRSAAGMAAGVGHAAAGVGRTGAHYGVNTARKAVHIGGEAADHIGGAAVGAVAGAASGFYGGARSGGSEHNSVAGTAVGGAVGAATGATAGAARGGAEGARRGITGLLGINRSKNSEGTPSGSSTGGGADGGASSASSNGSSQSASSDTGTAATPPPITSGDASNDVSDAGTATAPNVSTGDSGADTAQADVPSGYTQSDSGLIIPSSAAPDASTSDSDADAGTATAPDVSSGDTPSTSGGERTGTIFSRAYNAGATVGGATGHPINTANKAKNTASNAYSKVKGAKAQYDISQATDNFQTERTVAKSKIKNRVDDFFKGKYKDDGKGGKS